MEIGDGDAATAVINPLYIYIKIKSENKSTYLLHTAPIISIQRHCSKKVTEMKRNEHSFHPVGMSVPQVSLIFFVAYCCGWV